MFEVIDGRCQISLGSAWQRRHPRLNLPSLSCSVAVRPVSIWTGSFMRHDAIDHAFIDVIRPPRGDPNGVAAEERPATH